MCGMETRRTKLTLRPVDNNDVVGYMRRQEIRTYLRGLSNPERKAFIGNFSQFDPEVALAIVEMLPAVSGALAADHTQLMDRTLEAQHGEAITELQELEHGIEIAEGAVNAAHSEIVHEAGADPATFERVAAAFLKAASAPLLSEVRCK
jgi:hypothetical protein